MKIEFRWLLWEHKWYTEYCEADLQKVIVVDKKSKDYRRMKIGKRELLMTFVLSFTIFGSASAEKEDEFYSQRGTDPSFAEVMESEKLPRGKNSSRGFEGSDISINHELFKGGPNAKRPLMRDIRIHTLGNSSIHRKDFDSWTRWYQEDRNTQIFRLFKDEENVRNSRKLAARIESFSHFKWERGEWQEWVGTYTIIKPHRCAIFQAKNNINDWSVMINMDDEGNVKLNSRRGEDKELARRMVGKSFHMRIRDNGHDYEVYFNGKKAGEGSYKRPEGQNSFRWGMYLGAKEVKHDAMILVTGAAVNPKDSGETISKVEEVERALGPASDPMPKNAMSIPARTWTNRDGEKIEAEARYEIGSRMIDLKMGEKWVPYSLGDLSKSDRMEIARALETLAE
ncbi:MAG: hypothetical protein AB8D78_12575 [Akkermansiaceae bacterium]